MCLTVSQTCVIFLVDSTTHGDVTKSVKMTHISKFSDGLTIFTDDIKLMTKNDAKTTVIIQSSTHIWKIYQNKQVFRLYAN